MINPSDRSIKIVINHSDRLSCLSGQHMYVSYSIIYQLSCLSEMDSYNFLVEGYEKMINLTLKH